MVTVALASLELAEPSPLSQPYPPPESRILGHLERTHGASCATLQERTINESHSRVPRGPTPAIPPAARVDRLTNSKLKKGFFRGRRLRAAS